MKTIVTRSPIEAAKIIERGGIVAFPTETVYGLGANVFDEVAIAKIFEAKMRPADNPLIAHVASLEQVAELASIIPRSAKVFIDSFFPGPLTVVLPRSERVPLAATAGLNTIGVRMPQFGLANQFLSACREPVVAPSANLSGKPSTTTWHAVLEDLDGRIDCILQGDPTEIGLESTVVDCTVDVPILLRQGSISLEQLRSVVPETIEYKPVADDTPRSPGLKHRHYSPTATVSIISDLKFDISDLRSAAYIGLSDPQRKFGIALICISVADYAHSVFEFFRECDRRRIGTIYCETVPETGIGSALMDRLRRAALG